MKVMVVGGGGREHAIIKKLKENKKITEIFALPGNGGIAKDATCIDIKATDIQGITDFAKNNKIDFGSMVDVDTKAVIIVTSTGGGTGCGATPLISKVFSKNPKGFDTGISSDYIIRWNKVSKKFAAHFWFWSISPCKNSDT